MTWWQWTLVAIGAVLVVTAVYDLVQRKHAILRVFPVFGHLRFILEAIGPELRQYIITSSEAEKPFSRDQRRWIYASSKKEDNHFGFGTSNDLEATPGYLVIRQSAFPLNQGEDDATTGHADEALIPVTKVLGGPRGRTHAFRMPSVVNISSMSYGALSSAAVVALNRGAALGGCLHGSGEGGISPYHLEGGELIWQIGTAYFGCRDDSGRFSLSRFLDVVAANPQIRAIEIKLSQGAKPGLGGLLPAAKITPEISRIRGIPLGVDCVSPAGHTAFTDEDSLLDFVELLGERSGLPIGIKSAVGDESFFVRLADLMVSRQRGVDWITIDGGEGGTGAGPLTFVDHVSLPFKIGFSHVYRIFAERGLTDDVVFVGSGRLGLPHYALLAFALGCDGINVGREAMLAIGCIQAQRCHTGRCPTGVTSNQPWRMRGLDPSSKSVRVATYVIQLRRELIELSRACGVAHPALVTLDHIEILDDRLGSRTGREVFGYEPTWGRPTTADIAASIQSDRRSAPNPPL